MALISANIQTSNQSEGGIFNMRGSFFEFHVVPVKHILFYCGAVVPAEKKYAPGCSHTLIRRFSPHAVTQHDLNNAPIN